MSRAVGRVLAKVAKLSDNDDRGRSNTRAPGIWKHMCEPTSTELGASIRWGKASATSTAMRRTRWKGHKLAILEIKDRFGGSSKGPSKRRRANYENQARAPRFHARSATGRRGRRRRGRKEHEAARSEVNPCAEGPIPHEARLQVLETVGETSKAPETAPESQLASAQKKARK